MQCHVMKRWQYSFLDGDNSQDGFVTYAFTQNEVHAIPFLLTPLICQSIYRIQTHRLRGC